MRVNAIWSAVSLLLLCAHAPAREESVEQILKELVERTNALESFRVVYDVETFEDDGEGTGTVELVFEATDVARFRFARGTEEVVVWLLGTNLYTRILEKPWMRATLPGPPDSRNVLDELFPLDPRALGGGVAFILDIHDDPAGELSVFKMSITHSHAGNAALLK